MAAINIFMDGVHEGTQMFSVPVAELTLPKKDSDRVASHPFLENLEPSPAFSLLQSSR